MKHIFLTSSTALVLMTASFVTSAQTAAPASTVPAATPAQQSHTDPSDPSKGQELVGDQKQQPASPPETVGQDKATGNNLVEKTTAPSTNAQRPDFQKLDTKHQGYLTLADVKGDAWMSSNFARCDVSHDGHLTPKEYAACTQQ